MAPYLNSSLWRGFDPQHSDWFHISRIEDTKKFMKLPLPPHRKAVVDFILLTAGSCIRSKGLDKYEFGANTFFFLPAYQISLNEFMSDDIKGFYCHFNEETLFKNLVRPGFLSQFSYLQIIGNPLVTVDNESLTEVLSIMHRLEREDALDRPNYQLISAYLCALLLDLQSTTSPHYERRANSATRITQQYKGALTQYIYEKQTVGEYANLLNITPDYLNRCVKETVGKSAHDVLCDMILMEAKALLKQTSLSISEISYQVGKNDPSGFTHFFKSRIGFTPTQYREMSDFN